MKCRLVLLALCWLSQASAGTDFEKETASNLCFLEVQVQKDIFGVVFNVHEIEDEQSASQNKFHALSHSTYFFHCSLKSQVTCWLQI